MQPIVALSSIHQHTLVLERLLSPFYISKSCRTLVWPPLLSFNTRPMTAVKFAPCYTIPTLDEVINDDHLRDCGPYNRRSFLLFLKTSHCMENLEFFVEVDRLIQSVTAKDDTAFFSDDLIRDTESLRNQWLLIYRVFLDKDSAKEVNLPHKVALKFLPHVLPSTTDLLIIRKLGYELLLDTYNDFISHTRETTNDRTTRRRCLDLLAAEVTSPDLAQTIPRLTIACIHECSDLSEEWEKALKVYEESRESSSICSNCANTPIRARQSDSSSLLTANCSARCSSIGSLVDNIKDYSGWNRTKKKLRLRRLSLEKNEPMSQRSP